ncbi:MAG: T9SS type A sorting domain-containing protein [Saprospiraceae bacterium]
MKNTISILLLLLTSAFGFSQGWEQFYGGTTGLVRAFDAVQLPDGDYLILGNGTSITKTSETGSQKWYRSLPFGFISAEFFLLPSGNIALFDNDQMIEIDTAANIVFSNTIAPSLYTTQHMFPVEGGYVFTVHSTPGLIRMWKIDMIGNPVWNQEVTVSDIYPGGRGNPTPDGGFVFTGQSPWDVRLLKFDADGNLQWTATGATADQDGYNMDVIATADGGYAVAADGAGDDSTIRVFKFDENGNQLWWSEYIHPAPYDGMTQYLVELKETADGGFVVAGRLSDNVDQYPMVVKFGNDGAFHFFYVSPYKGRFSSIIQTNDGGYLAVGEAINPASGSSVSRAYAVKLAASGTVFVSYLEGQVALDEDLDCLISTGDLNLNNWVVRATGAATYYGITNADGHYQINVDTGAYLLEVIPPNNLWSPCDSPVPVTVSGIGDTLFNNFSVQAVIDCPAMQVDLAVPQLRRCFNNTLSIQYCNLGTVPAEDATIELTLDSLLELVSSDIPFSSQTGNTYTFSVGDVGLNECGSFHVVVLVSCESQLGQTLCMEAHAFPDTICGIPFNWLGASMMARAHCQGDSTVVLELENVGTAPTSEPIDYIVIEDQIIFMQGSEIFAPLELRSVQHPANGATWRITSEQEPNHPGNSIPTAFVEGCGTNDVNTFSTGFVNEHPQNDGDGFIDIDCEEVIGAFDPNDKMGLPKGYGAQHYIEPNTDLEYRIRFQNTGTDTAFTVVIRDTLSPFLDPVSLRAGAASHNYEFDLEGDAVAIFRFDNILLPDSNVNEALSHGFVSFRISQKPDVALESVIENEAAIYFDFNDPVITNPVFHTVGRNFIEIVNDIRELPEGLGALLSYPNPSAGEVTFEIPSEQPVKATFVVYDQFGRLVLHKEFEGKHFLFNGHDHPKGVYFYKVNVEGLGMYSGKIILK